MRKLILILAMVIPLTLTYSSPLLKNPEISPDGKKLLFSAHGDIYEGSINGGRAYSITNNAAYDGSAVYSKDGNYIAFSSDRNGISRKVYVYDRKGDSIYQVTFGRGYDYPLFFDHGKIVFLSRYRDYGNFVFSVPLKGGVPVKFFYGEATNMDANDKYIAYEFGYIGRHRYKYKGSAGYDIYLKLRHSKTPVKKVTAYKGNDIEPKIRGNDIYYISSMEGDKYDIYKYGIETGKIDRITHEPHNVYAFDVSRDGKILVFEEDYTLYKMSLPDGKPVKLNFSISPDMAKGETYFKEIDKVKGYAVSPINDSLFAINAFGEIFLYYPGILNKNLTNSPYWDKNPFLNKDGSVYFVSDRNGYFNIYRTDTLGNTKVITNDTLPEQIKYVSKDGGKIVYTTPLALYITDNGKTTKLDSGSIYNIVVSPHERYIAYSKLNRDGQSYSVSNIYVYDSNNESIHRLTTTGFSAYPVSFSNDCKKLYFTLNYNIRRLEYYSDLYSLNLTRPDALYKRLITKKGKKKNTKKEKERDVNFNYKNIGERINQLTHFKHLQDAVPSFDRSFIIVTVPNYKNLYFYKISLKKKNGVYNYTPKYLFKVANSSNNGVGNISLSRDGKFLYYTNNNNLFSVNLSSKSPEQVSFSYNLEINRKNYYKELFNAAWLMFHDYFYDPGYHGLNWNNEKKKYEPLMNRVNDMGTLSNIVYNMIGDLNASHTGFYPSEGGNNKQNYGDLGIQYTVRNHYPYITKIYAKGPCDKENVGIETGDYIVSIDGNDLKDKDPAEFLLNKVNEKVTVGVRKYMKGKTRKYAVVPVSGWTTYNLMYNDWVKHEEHIVDSLSHGELGYIHIRGMGNSSYYKFLNEILFKYSNKKGLVLDIRGNGGGFSQDYYITFFLKRPYLYEQNRYEKKYAVPLLTWAKPVDLLINEKSFSNAEMFPYSFRHMGIGKLIGVPTAGGVIGTYDIKLFDGTGFRLPEQAIMRYNGVNFENHAVQPDIYVENPPEDLLYNRDSQLEKAVEYLMSQIKGR